SVRSKAAIMSFSIWVLKAFSLSGRDRVSNATPSSISSFRVSNSAIALRFSSFPLAEGRLRGLRRVRSRTDRESVRGTAIFHLPRGAGGRLMRSGGCSHGCGDRRNRRGRLSPVGVRAGGGGPGRIHLQSLPAHPRPADAVPPRPPAQFPAPR